MIGLFYQSQKILQLPTKQSLLQKSCNVHIRDSPCIQDGFAAAQSDNLCHIQKNITWVISIKSQTYFSFSGQQVCCFFCLPFLSCEHKSAINDITLYCPSSAIYTLLTVLLSLKHTHPSTFNLLLRCLLHSRYTVERSHEKI